MEAAFPLGSIAFLIAFQQTPIYRQLQQKYLQRDPSDLELDVVEP